MESSPVRLNVLDGWRGSSILLVLACHLLPLGPHVLGLNEGTGRAGMAIFFTLSGFLITQYFLRHDSVPDFLIRRSFRILPLALVGLVVAMQMANASTATYWTNFLFVANLPPDHLVDPAGHYWSLCVEIQFYVGIALIFFLFGRRGLLLLPLICLAVTAHRISYGAVADVVTWRRVDEILAGCILALVVDGRMGAGPRQWLQRVNLPLMLVLLVVTSLPPLPWANYFRPYVAATLVGCSLYSKSGVIHRILVSKSLAYVASISFALYVLHLILAATWLGHGSTKILMYEKRPLLFAATFALAHVSTFYFEHPFINFGKRLSSRWVRHAPPLAG